MLKRRLTVTLSKLCVGSCSENSLLIQTTRAYGVDHEKRQYFWREKEKDLELSKPEDDPEKPKRFLWFPTAAPKMTDFSVVTLPKWLAQQKVEAIKYDQRFRPERHEVLGADLAAAHFIVHRGGRVKFKGDTQWTERDEKGKYDLSNEYNVRYHLEAIDVNGFDMYYEGLSNLCGLPRLRWLSLKNCKNIDDWGLDKISAEFPELEYLDISGCEKITERGLESLYRMFNLKTLIVTNHYKSVAFELTCLMLEDCVPGLTCKILEKESKE